MQRKCSTCSAKKILIKTAEETQSFSEIDFQHSHFSIEQKLCEKKEEGGIHIIKRIIWMSCNRIKETVKCMKSSISVLWINFFHSLPILLLWINFFHSLRFLPNILQEFTVSSNLFHVLKIHIDLLNSGLLQKRVKML